MTKMIAFSTDPEQLARLYYETYEQMTQVDPVPWDQVPRKDQALMIATAREVIRVLVERGSA